MARFALILALLALALACDMQEDESGFVLLDRGEAFDVHWESDGLAWEDLTPHLDLPGRAPARIARASHGRLEANRQWRIDYADPPVSLILDLKSHVEAAGFFVLHATLVNRSTSPVSIAGLALVAQGGLHIDGPRPLQWRMLRNGYQSWSDSGVLTLREGRPAWEGAGLFPHPLDPTLNALNETPWVSRDFLALNEPVSGRGWLIARGGVSNESVNIAAWWPDGEGQPRIAISWGYTGGTITLPAEGSRLLSPVHIADFDNRTLPVDRWLERLEIYSAPAASDVSARGWASWYDFFSGVTEEDIRAHIPVLRDSLCPDVGFCTLQLDDGYMPAWGDWHANDKFPAGLTALAQEIRDANLTPGIWMAPFLVQTDLPLVTDRPDWFVRNAAGDLITYANPGAPSHAILDATHPDARQWMADETAAMVERGYGFLKLDFLLAGATEGQRHDPTLTGSEAWELGMRAIRDAVGSDTYLLGSGAQITDAWDVFNGMRTGPDIAFEITDRPETRFLRAALDTVAARSPFADQLWQTDPDDLLLRAPLNDGEARTALLSWLVGGSCRFLGDDLTALDPDRLAWLNLEPIADILREGRAGLPLDPFSALPAPGIDVPPIVPSPLVDTGLDSWPPPRWMLAGQSTDYRVVFNWDTEPRILDIPLEDRYGTMEGRIAFGDGEIHRTDLNMLQLEIPAGGGILLK